MLATVQKCVHTAPKYGTKPIRYVTLHFRERGGGGASSLRHRNGSEITVPVCEQKPYPGGIPHLFERLFLFIWENNRDCHITVPLSLKTMEMQIERDQWNKRFRTVKFYCYPVWLVISVLTRISYTRVHKTHREAKRGLMRENSGSQFLEKVNSTFNSLVWVTVNSSVIACLYFPVQRWERGVRLRMMMTARLASATKRILAKMSSYLFRRKKVHTLLLSKLNIFQRA